MVEMLTGNHVWPQLDLNEQFIFRLMNLKENETPEYELDENASDELKKLLKLLFTYKYDDRPTAKSLLEHAFFQINK